MLQFWGYAWPGVVLHRRQRTRAIPFAVGAHGGSPHRPAGSQHRGARYRNSSRSSGSLSLSRASPAPRLHRRRQVARSAPDGYTLLVNPSLFVITPMLMNVSYDVVKDFTPISNFGTVPLAVGINPAIPAKTLQEFIALAKADPEKFTWGAEGVGAVGHLTMERLQREAGFKILIVHYRGTSPALLDLLAGRVSAMVSPVPNLIEQFRGGTVRPVAVATKTRVSTLPDVPTLEEAGFPNFEIGSWYGLWGPANLPRDVVATLNGAIAEAMKTPRVTERVAAQGLIPVGSSSADFAAFQNAEIVKFSQMIKDANIKFGN